MKAGKYLITKSGAHLFSSTVAHKTKAALLGEKVTGAGHYKKLKDGTVKVYGKAGSLGGIKAKPSDLGKVKKKL